MVTTSIFMGGSKTHKKISHNDCQILNIKDIQTVTTLIVYICILKNRPPLFLFSVSAYHTPDKKKEKENPMKTFGRMAFGPLIVLFFLAGCGGVGSSGGGTETREITGTVSSSGTSALKTQTDADCAADTVIATDPSGGTIVAEVDEICNFSLTLEIGQSYVISFSRDGVFVATLIFDSGVGGFTGSDLTITAGDGAIALGQITITGNVAIPEFEPEEQTDEDGDGLNDLEDEDDDNDGVEDELDGDDCDLDGVEGEEEEESCEEGDLARVLEVKPRNDPHPELGEDRVDLEKEVKARISCEVDQTTVTAETFRVESDADTIACTFEFSGTGSSGNRIQCKHDGQDFLPDTVYTATIDGVKCLDGRDVEPRSWSWLTEEEDEDEGDVEDDLDEEDEADDDEEEDDAEEDDDEGEED
jgi:hypothetical protein